MRIHLHNMQTPSRVTSVDSLSVDYVVRSRLRVCLHSLCRTRHLNAHAMRSACEVFSNFFDEYCIWHNSQACVFNWEYIFACLRYEISCDVCLPRTRARLVVTGSYLCFHKCTHHVEDAFCLSPRSNLLYSWSLLKFESS